MKTLYRFSCLLQMVQIFSESSLYLMLEIHNAYIKFKFYFISERLCSPYERAGTGIIVVYLCFY